MYPITEMLNLIKNALAVSKPTVSFPYSNLKFEVSRILEKEGFIGKIEKKGKKIKTIEMELKYNDKSPAISGMKTISRPGQRIYTSHKDIKKVKGGYGIMIISTSKGLLTDKEAKKQKIGGEILIEVW